MLPIINKNTMLVDIEAEDKLSLIQQMVDKFDSEGYLCDKEQFHKDVLDREEVSFCCHYAGRGRRAKCHRCPQPY